jgi:hypothetical protein
MVVTAGAVVHDREAQAGLLILPAVRPAPCRRRTGRGRSLSLLPVRCRCSRKACRGGWCACRAASRRGLPIDVDRHIRLHRLLQIGRVGLEADERRQSKRSGGHGAEDQEFASGNRHGSIPFLHQDGRDAKGPREHAGMSASLVLRLTCEERKRFLRIYAIELCAQLINADML